MLEPILRRAERIKCPNLQPAANFIQMSTTICYIGALWKPSYGHTPIWIGGRIRLCCKIVLRRGWLAGLFWARAAFSSSAITTHTARASLRHCCARAASRCGTAVNNSTAAMMMPVEVVCYDDGSVTIPPNFPYHINAGYDVLVLAEIVLCNGQRFAWEYYFLCAIFLG